MANEKVEVDDFGLPIRKAAPPPPPAEEPQNESKDSVVKDKSQDKPEVADKKANDTAEEESLSPATGAQKTAGATEESDEDDFKDALSTPGLPKDTTKASSSKDDTKTPEPVEANTAPTDASEPKPDVTATASAAVSEKAESTNEAKVETKESKPEEPVSESSKQEGDDAAIAVKDNPTDERKRDKTGPADHNAQSPDIPKPTAGVGEFSHQQATAKEPEQKKDDEDDDWQEMPSYAPYDIYDDDNKLIAKEHAVEEDEAYGYGGLGGAGKGYTRVIMDDDAESATSMDDNTKYLFKGTNGTNLANEDEDDEARDAVSQMQATKDLLTEGQRIAYVGLTRLEISQLIKEAESLEKTKGAKKEINMGAEATKMWGQKMMIRVYAHMEISEAEQIMVEQLSDHGVLPADLTPVLMANARVKNPMAEEEEKKKQSMSSDRDSISLPSPSKSSLAPDSPVATRHESLDDKLREDETPKRGDDEDYKQTEDKKSEDKRSDEKGHNEEGLPEDNEEPAAPPPPYEAHPTEDLDVKTPSQLPTSENLEIDLRWTVLCDLFLLLIADSTYDSRSRTLLERVGKSLEIDWLEIRKFEKKVTDALEMQQQAEKENWNEDEHMETRRKEDLKKRYVMMGLATVGGGLVIGLSAGLLAPLIGAGLAAGFTTIGVGGTSAFLGGAGGAALITTASASAGSVVGVRAANRRTGAVKTFEYRPLHNNKRVNLIVSISGWMTGKVDDVRLPFSTVDPMMGDLYSVLWEPEMLRSTGDTINILATEALTQGLQQVLGSTILMGLMAALQLPIILSKLSYLIDNPWAVSLDRATSAGKILADSLIDRNLGTRPVTLVGFSIGARVIFSCLQELAKRGAYGLVQNVYMFGSPVVVKKDEYLKARTVVPGRFLNGYNKNDWILGYLFRLTSGGIQRVAGLAPIEGLPWLENMDCTELVKGHMEYRKMMPRLLRESGWLVESDEFTEIEDPDPENHSQRQRELINEIEEARKELEKEGQKKKSSRFSIFGRKKQLEKADWEIYEDAQKDAAKRGETSADGTNRESNDDVLFDVEAIRAELAKDQMEVKELKSTLPPMKLDLAASESASLSPRDTLRGHQSTSAIPTSSSTGNLQPYSVEDRTPSPVGSTTRNRLASPYYAASEPHLGGNSDISMTFDDSFNDPPSPPPKDANSNNASRPEMKSANTVPNMTLRDPWNDPDDEDFGKEKEMTMTFA